MTRSGASRGAPAPARREPANGDAVTQSMVVRAEQQSEQRFGSAAWCHVSGPGRGGVCTDTDDRRAVRTYFAERTEDEAVGGHRAAAAGPDRPNSSSRKSNSPTRVTLRRRRSAAGIRNGRRRNVPSALPPMAAMPSAPGGEAKAVPSDQPWYTALWHTIADEPHGVAPKTTPEAPPAAPAPHRPARCPSRRRP